jgi:hypothetical protein
MFSFVPAGPRNSLSAALSAVAVLVHCAASVRVLYWMLWDVVTEQLTVPVLAGHLASTSFNAATCASQSCDFSTNSKDGAFGVHAKAPLNTVVVGVDVAVVERVDVRDVLGVVDNVVVPVVVLVDVMDEVAVDVPVVVSVDVRVEVNEVVCVVEVVMVVVRLVDWLVVGVDV